MRYLVSVVVLVTFLLILGCSGGNNSPVAPSSYETASMPTGSIDTLPIIAPSVNSDGSFNALGLLGAYELRIDKKDMSAELVSQRLPSLGQSYLVSGIGYFTIAPCHDCLRIIGVGLSTEGYLQLTFQMKHPFAAGNPTLPPTGINRLDLDLFDPALVVVPIGGTKTTYSLTAADAYTGILENNAGYTKELANLLTDTAAMPFALVVDNSTGATSTFNIC